MQIHREHESWNPWKSLKIYEIPRKSSEDKKPAWSRAQVSTGAASRVLTVVKHPCLEIHENLWKYMKICENAWKSVKSHWNLHNLWKSCVTIKVNANLWNAMKVFRGQEASLESSKGSYRGNRSHLQKSKPANMQILSLFVQGHQLHLQGALTSCHRGIEGWRGRRQRR